MTFTDENGEHWHVDEVYCPYCGMIHAVPATNDLGEEQECTGCHKFFVVEERIETMTEQFYKAKPAEGKEGK